MEQKIKLLPSGINDFERIRRDNLYYVDKTQYISVLEHGDSYLFFGRPRRFGKSLFVSMLEAYYDIKNKDRFDELFSGLWIHEHPTERRGFYQVMVLDFSKVNGGADNVEENFNTYCGNRMIEFAEKYEEFYYKGFANDIKNEKNATERINIITSKAKQYRNPLYLIVDEYDNFTNTILSLHDETVYLAITHGEGFYRDLFKKFKGGFERIFLTGVSPVTLDDLTSGFNIASYVSQYSELNQLLGFSETDVKEMIKYYHSVGKIKGDLQQQTDFIISTIKPWCNNFCFSLKSFENNEPSMYNGMMVLYYMNLYMKNGQFPDDMTAPNSMMDYGKLDHLVKLEKLMGNNLRDSIIHKAANEEYVLGVVKEHFPATELIEDENFISLMYYYGMLTIRGKFGFRMKLSIPNNNIRKQYYQYIINQYNQSAKIDVSHLQDTFDSAAMFGEWKDMFEYVAERYKVCASNRNSIEGERNIQGYFMAYLSLCPYYLMCPEIELNHGYCDIFLMPDRRFDDVKHSYIVEFKYVNTNSSAQDVLNKFDEATAQLSTYAADAKIQNMTAGTTLHKMVMVFKGLDLTKCEEG
ncbi:MAG: AAA family ATPase [Bacteroidales bacterium]|nr:AAA family ATPase [Bacteroidales bacterium]